MKVRNFRCNGFDFTNYFAYLVACSPSVALSRMISTDEMDATMMVKSLQAMGQFETKRLDIIASCFGRKYLLAIGKLRELNLIGLVLKLMSIAITGYESVYDDREQVRVTITDHIIA